LINVFISSDSRLYFLIFFITVILLYLVSPFYRIGITRKEELAITSNRAVAKETGVDFIELAEKKGISTLDRYFTVTELCQKVIGSDNFSEKAKAIVSTKKGDKL
jgi:uncharacterized metal-binding protein